MNQLELVRAGAGAGKTYNLCEIVAKAVEDGTDPSRILATTFTKKAAAELKGRIQAKLLSSLSIDQAAEQADRLELAAIGTVHGVAHKLIKRYAVEIGLSPRLDVLTETSRDSTLGNLLVILPSSDWQELADVAGRMAINNLHQMVLKLLSCKRGNSISADAFQTQMNEGAERVCQLLLAEGSLETDISVTELRQLAASTIEEISQLTDTTQKTKTALTKLAQIRTGAYPHWGSYLVAQRLDAGKKSGADRRLDALRTHAGVVRRNSNLHGDVRRFSNLLAEQTLRLEKEYVRYKSDRGLVDYDDLEIILLDLLKDERMSNQIATDYELIIVDEFQDTNPIQLAIFQRLRELSPRSRWVGDPNQAIYGFRGTDPALVNGVWENTKGAEHDPLKYNYRSQRGLVQLVGKLFSPLLGENVVQIPQREMQPRGIERWLINSKNQDQAALSLACGVRQLHQDGVAWGEIAVLERTNAFLKKIAQAFDELGIPYLLECPGLFSTREGRLLLAGLRLVADRHDSLAAATIVHLLGSETAETPEWLAERLSTIRAAESKGDVGNRPRPWENDLRLLPLEHIDRKRMSPLQVVQLVIEALKLPSLVQQWGETVQRNSHLDSAIELACEYEENARSSGQAATLSGLILALEQMERDEKDSRKPPVGHDAVTLMTYHAAKGLEWPVVVLGLLKNARETDMWSPEVSGGGGEQNPLAERQLRYWPWPFGDDGGGFGELRKGSGLEVDALNSPEGQGRSDREAMESLRLLYVGCTRAKHKLVFAHQERKCDWLDQLSGVDQILDPGLEEAEHPLEDIETTFVIRKLSADMLGRFDIPEKSQERWINLKPLAPAEEQVQRYYSPSQSGQGDEETPLRQIELAGPSVFPSGAKVEQYADIGEAVHGYFAGLFSSVRQNSQAKQNIAVRCLSAYGLTGILTADQLVSTGERFCQWVRENYPDAIWHSEVSVSAPRNAGGQWSGIIDLILELPSGEIIILDHKSAPLQRKYCEEKARTYAGQLQAYREIMEGAGYAVQSMGIHYPLSGVVVWSE
ncbi:UvrD-helicase domain-containing protein [Gimesia sp.]|uniref:UvrD-helicase domain-containing protein n=1 Tax=Gimesia sp. TaxID=2024833 RepID=UPI003A94DD9A